MRISDWSSDVCSSDLVQPCQGGVQTGPARRCQARRNQAALRAGNDEGRAAADEGVGYQKAEHCVQNPSVVMPDLFRHPILHERISAERRVGKGVVSTCRSRLAPCLSKKNVSMIVFQVTVSAYNITS